MTILRHLERIGRRFRAPVLTLGNFDGVHRGHQEILRRLVTRARALDGDPIVITFRPHPAAVLTPERAPRLITDWRARLELIAEFGIEAIVVQRFTREFAAVTAEDFVRRLLIENLGVRAVVVGHRVNFGHNREGHGDSLRQWGVQYGFDVEIVGPVEAGGMLVSSSAVRHAIGHGDLERAALLLGRPPSVAGHVVHGAARGHGLGFPTANLRVPGLVLPPDGVYAVRVRTGAGQRLGVANIGVRPTFADMKRSLEVHLLDWRGDLYRQRLDITFVKQLRGEQRFSSPAALAEQIARDVAAARALLTNPKTR
ncbi:bifunctional riboflavin kinase/FAD synthetase [Candidatus Binatia bacterium]|nr:bifunctional riboflavin kinase/FAD synthetase [Candidatus Binatia bacterium]